MKLSNKEKEALETLRNITHEPIEKINNILLGLMTYSLLNYTDKEAVTIPYFGTFLIKYKGDKITDNGREAMLESFFDPSDYLKENIGAYEDYKKSSSKDITTIPIMKYLSSLNEQSLHMTLNDIVRTEDE